MTMAADIDEQRRAEKALVVSARRRTAELGLDGFTVDSLCEEVGVPAAAFSTFFASKEDAVIGMRFDRAAMASTVQFLTGGDGVANDLGPDLLTELTDLAVERWGALDLDARSVSELAAALRREPRLAELLGDRVAARERFDARIIVHREDLSTGDPRAEAASLILSRLVRESALDVLVRGADEPFDHILRRRVSAAHALFATQSVPR